jgi:hypothetical protein
MIKSVMAEAPRSIEAAVSSGEHAFGNNWRHRVEVRANQVKTEVFGASNDSVRESAAKRFIKQTTGFDNIDVLIEGIETNPHDEGLFHRRELLTQSLAMAMINGTEEQQEALVSGDVTKIQEQLPEALVAAARDVRDVIVEPEVGERVTELEFSLLDTPGSTADDAETIDNAIKGIQNWMIQNRVGKNDERRTGAIRIVGMLQMRRNELREVVDGNRGKENETVEAVHELVNEMKKESNKKEEDEEQTKLPENAEGQREMARKALDAIEELQYDPWSIEASYYKRALDRLVLMKDKLDAGVKQEIMARLRLQRIFGFISGSGGWLDMKTDAPIERQLLNASKEGGLFTIDDVKFFLKGKGGLSVAMAGAWDEFEKINLGKSGRRGVDAGSYNDILVEMAGDAAFLKKMGDKGMDVSLTTIAEYIKGGIAKAEDYVDKEKMWSDAYQNYYSDANEDRKAMVRAFIAEKILRENIGKIGAEKRDMTEYEATKGVELAWNFMEASGETSIYNFVFKGHNDLSELNFTKFDTLDRMAKGKTIGALTCLQKITSMSTTWLRYMSNRTVFSELKAKDVDVEKMAEISKYSIDYWYSSIVTEKLFALKMMMRSESASPKELLDPATFKKVGEWIDKAAKYPCVILDYYGKPIIDRSVGSKDTEDFEGRPLVVTDAAKNERARRLRFLVVAGWAEQAMSNIDLGWDQASWKTFRDVLTREYSLEEGEERKTSFITKEEMKYIDKYIVGNIMGSYPKLARLESIRKSRKEGTWNFLKPEQKSFDV